jgi:hyperosmotically inducible periplasmic protein
MTGFAQIRRAAVAALALLLGTYSIAAASPRSGQQPDNTKTNQSDANKDAATAQGQTNSVSDLATTKQIRATIMKDKGLSTYAHNVKIITQDGKVTLKGPVRSQEEQVSLEAKAMSIAGAANVTSELTIAPPKQ